MLRKLYLVMKSILDSIMTFQKTTAAPVEKVAPQPMWQFPNNLRLALTNPNKVQVEL